MLPAAGNAKAAIVTVRAKKWWRRKVKYTLYGRPPAKRRTPRKRSDVAQSETSTPGSRLDSRAPRPFRSDGRDNLREALVGLTTRNPE